MRGRAQFGIVTSDPETKNGDERDRKFADNTLVLWDRTVFGQIGGERAVVPKKDRISLLLRPERRGGESGPSWLQIDCWAFSPSLFSRDLTKLTRAAPVTESTIPRPSSPRESERTTTSAPGRPLPNAAQDAQACRCESGAIGPISDGSGSGSTVSIGLKGWAA